jgi:hypothetical protein
MTPYGESFEYLIKLAIEANNKGDHFPILGICVKINYFLFELNIFFYF